MQELRKSQNVSPSKELSDLERWNSIAREYDAHITRGDFFRTRLLDPAVYELLGELSGKVILDAGCGQGYLAHELSQRGARVTAFDGAEKLIGVARNQYGETEDVHFMVQDLTKPLPFANHSFDTVVANMVLMDIEPLAPVIRELGRVLKEDGLFVFSILHPLFATGTLRKGLREHITRTHPFYAISHYATPHKKAWHIPGTSGATNVYHRPLETYIRALSDAGLSITDIREPVFTQEEVRGKNGAMRALAEIPMFLIVRAQKLIPHAH